MSDCQSIDSLVTPFVDGELDGPDRDRVEEHLRVCALCASRVASERVVARLCHERRHELCTLAPADLAARCVPVLQGADVPVAPPRTAWRVRRVLPLAAAAALFVGVAWFATATSAEVIAAELAVDHLKCRLLNAVLGTRHSEDEVRQLVRRRFDWDVTLPAHPERDALALVGTRPCLYQHGTIAHIMYRHDGKLASLYMLPGIRQPEQALRALGHETIVWSQGDRTFVVIERARRSEVERTAAVLRTALDGGELALEEGARR